MSDEKPRPFAEVEPDHIHTGGEYDWWCVRIGGVAWAHQMVRGAADKYAADINAAVEQREARLVAALRRLLDAMEMQEQRERGELHVSQPNAIAVWDESQSAARAALDSHGDYVPRTELEAEQAKTKALQAAMDVLDGERGMTERVVCEWLEANGLKKPRQLEAYATGDLEAELGRRKQLGAIDHIFSEHEYGSRDDRVTITGTSYCGRALDYDGDWTAVTPDIFRSNGVNMKTCVECALRFALSRGATWVLTGVSACAHCNDLPYGGQTLACPECGVDRHGVGHGAG